MSGETLYRNATDFIPLTIIPLTDFPVFNATGLADLLGEPKHGEGCSRRNPMQAEIRLVALESDLSRRNQMQADESGWHREKSQRDFVIQPSGCEERATLG